MKNNKEEPSRQEILIRTIQPEEWDKLKSIRLQAIYTEPKAFPSQYAEEVHWSKKDWIKSLTLKNRSWLFADRGGKIIGMIGSIQNYHNEGKEVAYVTGFYVDPEYRKRNIGKKLVSSLIEEIKRNPEIKKIKLYVTQTQTEAINLYSKFGFKIVDKLKVKVDDKDYYEYQMEQIE